MAKFGNNSHDVGHDGMSSRWAESVPRSAYLADPARCKPKLLADLCEAQAALVGLLDRLLTDGAEFGDSDLVSRDEFTG
jgi:hypothetical protein